MTETQGISIIVPMYNSEKYIQRCLSSILAQTIENIEVLCIDDGSSDATVQICKNIQYTDNRIQIYEQTHQGVAAARNYGLRMAAKEYIGFVDSDDWVEPDMYKIVLQNMIRENADIGVTNFYVIDDNFVKISRDNKKAADSVFDAAHFVKYAFERESYKAITAWTWNKVFRRKLLIEHDIWFDETLMIGEDVEFLVKILVHSINAIYCDIPLYNHMQRVDSLSKEYCPEKFCDRLRAYEMSIHLLEKNYFASDTVQWLKIFYCYHASNFVEIAIQNNDVEEAEKHKKDILRYYAEYKAINWDKKDRLDRLERIIGSRV